MIERICTSNNAISVIELLQKINELIDQVNTLTADVQMLLQVVRDAITLADKLTKQPKEK